MKIDFISDINRGYEAGLNYPSSDRFMLLVHWFSFASIVLLTITNAGFKIYEHYPSPFSWRVISPTEAFVSVGLAFLAALIPTLLVKKIKNHYLWRLLVTLTLSIFAYLAVFVSGGSIEMHFIFFAMIALVAIYADWRLGWVMLVLVALHHTILNYFAPTWVYFYGRNDFSVFAHAVPVVIAVIFTTMLCITHRTTIKQIQGLRDDLNALNKELQSSEK